jgi:hypothetical protein
MTVGISVGSLYSGEHKPIPKGQEGNIFGFYEYLPSEDDVQENNKWPLVICWHGAGKRGDGSLLGLKKVLGSGPAFHIERGKTFPAIVISPQTPQTWPTTNALEKFVMYIKDRYKKFIDHQRIYLLGQSMGGAFTWRLGQAMPDVIAAIVPMCGATPVGRKDTTKMVGMGVWAIHNNGDPTVPVKNTTGWINAINESGGSTKKTIYNHDKHDCWTKSYANTELWDWLFEQRLSFGALPAHAPETKIIYPEQGESILGNGVPQVSVEAQNIYGFMKSVKFYINDTFVLEDDLPPYALMGDDLNSALEGDCKVTAVAESNEGLTSYETKFLLDGIVQGKEQVFAMTFEDKTAEPNHEASTNGDHEEGELGDELPYTIADFEGASDFEDIEMAPKPIVFTDALGQFVGEMEVSETKSRSKSIKASCSTQVSLIDKDGKLMVKGHLGLMAPELGDIRFKMRLTFANGSRKSTGWHKMSLTSHESMDTFKKSIRLNGDEVSVSSIQLICRQVEAEVAEQVLVMDQLTLE